MSQADTTGSGTQPSVIECRGLTKRFGGTTALADVSVEFRTSEVHSIVGENGAGKSTLGKVIAGVHQPDEGVVTIDGATASLRTPKHALGHGITMVAQELSLVPGRSVLDNVFLGTEDTRAGFVDRRASRRRFDALVERYDMAIDPHARVGDLSVAEQQRVEILRALARSARFIIMDEPTARLSHHEALALADNVTELTAAGVGIIYVSHFLDEVLRISDAITVMRNGEVVRTAPASVETKDSLIEGVAGRTLDATFPARIRPPADAEVVLDVQGLGRTGAFENVSFQIRAGEIVTLAGLVGAGRTEVARAVFGADAPTTGSMQLDGRPFAPSSPQAAIRAGIGMIPESRRSQGLFFRRNVRENVTVSHLPQFSQAGVLRRRDEQLAADAAATDVELRGATTNSLMDELSGGNQQKTLFARWMMSPPRLLIADEPTRGVDVGAKRAIYEMLTRLAASGMGVLVVSSELEEVLGLAHRVLVMRAGTVVGALDGETAQEHDVMRLAFGAAEEVA
ncbi:MAG: sugar ABC transporter ATP-binding protein [Actinomycetota bacterium]